MAPAFVVTMTALLMFGPYVATWCPPLGRWRQGS